MSENQNVSIENLLMMFNNPVYECSQGHCVRGAFRMSYHVEGEDISTGDICMKCYFDSLTAAYPTSLQVKNV